MSNEVKRCIKCNYFDAAPHCEHCQKCIPVEVSALVDLATIEILKVRSKKNLLREVN